jgi:hypothetical protein
VDASHRGVRVQLVLDYIGGSDIGKQAVTDMEEAGVTIGLFNPPRFTGLEEVNYRTYRKILVVYGTRAGLELVRGSYLKFSLSVSGRGTKVPRYDLLLFPFFPFPPHLVTGPASTHPLIHPRVR